MPGAEVARGRPSSLSDAQFLSGHQQRGHAAMLFGEVRSHGWWYHYPVVAVLKSTPVEFAVMLVMLLRLSKVIRDWFVTRSTEFRKQVEIKPMVWSIILLVEGGMLLLGRVQIGYLLRHAAPAACVVVEH